MFWINFARLPTSLTLVLLSPDVNFNCPEIGVKKINYLWLYRRHNNGAIRRAARKVDNFQPVRLKRMKDVLLIHKNCGKLCGKRVHDEGNYDECS
jgi:hypothetical protein